MCLLRRKFITSQAFGIRNRRAAAAAARSALAAHWLQKCHGSRERGSVLVRNIPTGRVLPAGFEPATAALYDPRRGDPNSLLSVTYGFGRSSVAPMVAPSGPGRSRRNRSRVEGDKRTERDRAEKLLPGYFVDQTEARKRGGAQTWAPDAMAGQSQARA
jgi:hypothetical protein